MTYLPKEGKADAEGNDANTERRNFIKGAAAAGLLGAVGMTSGFAQRAEPTPQAEVQDPQAPAGLRPLAQPDCRFPIAYETSVPEGMRLLTQFFAALCRRDLAGMAQTLHYPFVTFEGIDAVIVDSAEKLMADPPPSLNVTGKGNLIKPGAYDMMESIQLHVYSPIAAGFSLDFSRYRSDGHKLLACNGIYGITNNDGKWGIEYLSTIFTPADQLFETYDAESALNYRHDIWRDHDLARKYSDLDQMRRESSSVGRRVFVWIGGTNSTSGSAREGRPMEPYRIKGVKSRLQVTDTTQDDIDHPRAGALAAMSQNQAQFLDWSGGGVGKWAASLEFPGPRGRGSRVLLAGTDKAHVSTGYVRYTADGTVINETRMLETITYRRGAPGRWRMAGMFGEAMYQDCTNDVRA